MIRVGESEKLFERIFGFLDFLVGEFYCKGVSGELNAIFFLHMFIIFTCFSVVYKMSKYNVEKEKKFSVIQS